MNSIYYQQMLMKNRFIPIIVDGQLLGIITFYIGYENSDFQNRPNQWQICDDFPEGDMIYIDHFLSKSPILKYHAIRVWKEIKEYLKNTYPRVNKIKFVRYNIKKEKLNVYSSPIN